MDSNKRPVFFISDSTGITAEAVGHSLLQHFAGQAFDEQILSFVDTEQAALNALDKIAKSAQKTGLKPIVIETIMDSKIRAIIDQSDAHKVDVISTFISPLEALLGQKADARIGRPEVSADQGRYQKRIDAMQFALDNDDGRLTQHYEKADIILLGVSRSGKTPTSIFLALQANVYAANYPLTEDDFDTPQLPKVLLPFRHKLYGLTIDPSRLRQIRDNRKSGSHYASLRQCEDETRMAEAMFKRFDIPYINTSRLSIEEISTRVIVEKKLRDQLPNSSIHGGSS